MARVSVVEDVLVVTPASSKEVPRTASAVRRARAGTRRDPDGAYRLPLEAVCALAASLPPVANDWSLEAAQQLAVEQERQRLADCARRAVASAVEDPLPLVGDYPLLGSLDWHQVQALAVSTLEGLDGLALFDEQGTGKTVTCLCAFDLLRQRGLVDQMLVVAPKSLVQTWATTVEAWLEDCDVTVLQGSAERRARDLPSATDVVVLTYESATRDVGLVAAWASRHGRRTLLVVDESFFVKNPDARRSRAVAEVREACTRAIVACGTPAPNTAVDVVNQVDLVDRGYAFGPVRVGAGAGDPDVIAVALRTRAVYLRRLKDDVLPDLPIKQFRRVHLPLQPRQATLYRQIRDELALEVGGIDDRDFRRQYAHFFARRSALLQVCSHPAAVDPSYKEVPAKLLALDTLLHDLIEVRGEKVVLWSFFRYTLEQVVARYSRYSPVRVDGSVTDIAARAGAVDAFQEDPTVRLFVGNPAAAGAGITLTAACHAVYESFSNQGAHYLQSLDRLHRRGQTREVTNHVLLCDGTIEMVDYEKLLDKESKARELLGDAHPTVVTRDEFLADLQPKDDH